VKTSNVCILLAAGGLIVLTGCGNGTSAGTSSVASAPVASIAPSTAPPGVIAAAKRLVGPSDKVTAPVQWVETTYGAYVKALGSNLGAGQVATPAKSDEAVYVVQLVGDFQFTGSRSGGLAAASPGPSRMKVLGAVVPVSSAAANGYEGWESSSNAQDLSRIGPVSTFSLG
jgi:hypothetical protein